jgi:hypothetical protein
LRVPPSSFEGCGVEAVPEWAAQCHGVDTSLTAQSCTVAGMAYKEGSRNSVEI